MSGRQLALVAVLVVVVALVAWRWKSDGTSAQHGHGPTAVELTAVRSGAAPVQLSAIGNVVSPHTVNVRAQVSGTLTQIFFTEGDSVKAGDKLRSEEHTSELQSLMRISYAVFCLKKKKKSKTKNQIT